MKDYELALLNVKAILFDCVYHEQGLLDILSKTSDLSPDAQLQLPVLYSKQKEDIEKVLDSIKLFETSMQEVLKTSEKIAELTEGFKLELTKVDLEKKDGTSVDSKDGNTKVETEKIVPAVENNVTTTPESNQTSIIDNVIEAVPAINQVPVVNNNVEVAPAINEVPTVENEAKSVIPSQDGSVVSGNVGNIDSIFEPISLENVNLPPVPDINSEENNVSSENKMEVSNQENINNADSAVLPINDASGLSQETMEPVVPVNEVIKVPGQTSGLDEIDVQDIVSDGFDVSSVQSGVIENVPVMTPEQVVKGANQQLQSIENVKQEIINNSQLTEEAKQQAIEKYVRATSDVVKAILVTKVQYEKLIASKTTQQSLINSKNNENKEVLVENQNADSVGLAAAPSVQDKQKEIEAMMNQANELYKAGRTQEAQDIYTKISDINKAIQTSSPAVEFVKK